MVGTRGVPAAYGGFETAVEEIGSRLAARGHHVLVYCRTGGATARNHLGMRLVHLPAVRSKSLETLTHTLLSAVHSLVNTPADVAFVFNAANAPFLPIIRARGVPAAVHVDGLEWKRAKWGPVGRRFYKLAERLSVRWADALIADAQGIADYYTEEFGVATELLAYGTKIVTDSSSDRLVALGLEPGRYHLVVARFEPENHIDLIVEGYAASDAALPLVVVGTAPYAASYINRIADAATADSRIRLLGGVWDQTVLDQLYAHAASYLHGHSVGGTNPSLLRAMGAGTAVLAWDVNFNREVLGDAGVFFHDARRVTELIREIETDSASARARADRGKRRAIEFYDWDSVTDGYERLAERLVAGAARPRSRQSRS
jgi:glycosyltransferase involved in cell wall biosynthesis